MTCIVVCQTAGHSAAAALTVQCYSDVSMNVTNYGTTRGYGCAHPGDVMCGTVGIQRVQTLPAAATGCSSQAWGCGSRLVKETEGLSCATLIAR